MSPSSQTSPDLGWEKQHAPRVTRGRLVIALAIYGIWFAFLAVIAANRWLGALQ